MDNYSEDDDDSYSSEQEASDDAVQGQVRSSHQHVFNISCSKKNNNFKLVIPCFLLWQCQSVNIFGLIGVSFRIWVNL